MPARSDNSNEADILVLKGHLLGAQKARENLLKCKTKQNKKIKEGRGGAG